MGRGSLPLFCEDGMCRRCHGELRNTFTDAFHHIINLYEIQSYLLTHHSWRSVIAEKRPTDLFSEQFLKHPCCVIPATQVSCQWHLRPRGPSHSWKRLFSSPRRTREQILRNAARAGGSDFTVGTWIGNSRRVPFCCLGEHRLLKVDWSASKVNKRTEKSD